MNSLIFSEFSYIWNFFFSSKQNSRILDMFLYQDFELLYIDKLRKYVTYLKRKFEKENFKIVRRVKNKSHLFRKINEFISYGKKKVSMIIL